MSTSDIQKVQQAQLHSTLWDMANNLHHEGLHDDAQIFEIALNNLLESYRETIGEKG